MKGLTLALGLALLLGNLFLFENCSADQANPGTPPLSNESVAQTFANRADAMAASIPPSVVQIMTLGFAAPGDGGGGNYVRTPSCAIASAGCFQSVDGSSWILGDFEINIRQFGAVPQVNQDQASFISDALQFANSNYSVGSVNFTAGVYNLYSHLPCLAKDIELHGKKGPQGTILAKNYDEPDPTRGVLCFTQWAPYLTDVGIAAFAGSGGSGISMVQAAGATIGEPRFERLHVSGGDHLNYSFYFDGSANPDSPQGLRNIFIRDTFSFGAKIASVYFVSVHQALITGCVFDTSGGSGPNNWVITGVPNNPSVNISFTGVLNALAFDYASAVTINSNTGSVTATANTSTVKIFGNVPDPVPTAWVNSAVYR